MNFRKTRRGVLPTFQMTSMMDIIFLLLFFFITTSVFSQWEYEINISLPSAQSGKVPDRLPGEIIINLDSEGVITVNQHALTPDDLLDKCQRLVKLYPGHPVVIRSDKGTRYEHLVVVIDTCRKADIWSFSMATTEEKSDATEKQ